MGEVTVIILHPPPAADGPRPGADEPLTALLDEARTLVAEHHTRLFEAAGADRVVVDRRPRAATFGDRLGELASSLRGGLVLMGAGAVPRLRPADAARLVAGARGGERALTNDRFSSDVLALPDASWLRGLPAVSSDNVLPRRLAEAGTAIDELPGHDRLRFDLDTPLDLALLALTPDPPRSVLELARSARLTVPRLSELRALATDPGAELLVFGRASARELAWLERNAACRVRFLAEERGLRTAPAGQRPARASIGRLLEVRGPGALADVVAELADAAIIDSRVLLADRFGRDEAGWPRAEDRFASDLLQTGAIDDAWLRALTASAAGAPMPILLGGHTMIGPALRWLLGRRVPSSA